MTNIYLTDSDKKTKVEFVKDHEELYDKTKIKQGRSVCGSSSPTVASCLSILP